MKDFRKEYREELVKIREATKEFGLKYPEIAPMLGEVSNDPDVERLLEGVAYLNALIQRKLDTDFPEILYELISVLYPHYLSPIPSISIMRFTPDNSLDSALDLQKFSGVKAKAYDQIKCEFSTTWDISLSPLKLDNVSYKKAGENRSQLILDLSTNGNNFSSIALETIDFFINDNKYNSANITSLLSHNLEKIEVYSGDKKLADLNINSLSNLGFDANYSLLPSSNNSLTNYLLLQEYFMFPEKFRFFKLNNISKLKNLINTDKFTINFSFNHLFDEMEKIDNKSISLHCVPVVNIFRDTCEPVKLKNINSNFLLSPSWKYRQDYRIYNVVEVIGVSPDENENIKYNAFNEFSNNQKKSLYKITRRKSLLENKNEECFMKIFRKKNSSFNEVLSITIDVTNGEIPEKLSPGDICLPTKNSPARSTFENIIVPTPMIEAPIEANNLWFLISHATMNILNIDNIEKLKEMLRFYIGKNSRDKSRVESSEKKIKSISAFSVSESSYVSRGTILRG